MDDSAKVVLLFFLLVGLAFFVLLGPVFTIWSLNCLFGLEIPVSFPTWCAMAWIHLVVARTSVRAKNSN